AECGEAGCARVVLFAPDYCCFVPACVPAGSAGGPHVPAAGVDQNPGRGIFIAPVHYAGAAADADVHSGPSAAGIRQSDFTVYPGSLSSRAETLPALPEDHYSAQPDLPVLHPASGV